MSSLLTGIASRRAELSLIARYERKALIDNQLWSSGPFLAAELVLDSGKLISSGYWIRHIAKALLRRVLKE